MKTRNGKIARLPYEIREEINLRLERSEPSPRLLAWLNGLPEVKKLLDESFGGEAVSRQNLSQWRQGGFQDWLAREDVRDGIANMEDIGADLGEGVNVAMVDKVCNVLAARYACLIGRWNGQCPPAVEAQARVLHRVCLGVTRLQLAAHRADRENFEAEERLEKREKEELDRLRKKAVDMWTDLLKVGPLAEMFGGGKRGDKIARFILAVQGDRMDTPDARLDLATMEKLAAEDEKPRTRKKKKDAKAHRQSDEPAAQQECEGGARSVKVCQSDLPPGVEPHPDDLTDISGAGAPIADPPSENDGGAPQI